jgi:hypothetical protein
MKNNSIHHILRRNYLLKYVIEGKIEGKRRRGRRRKQLVYDLKEKRRYWNLKEETPEHTACRTRFEVATDLSQDRLGDDENQMTLVNVCNWQARR